MQVGRKRKKLLFTNEVLKIIRISFIFKIDCKLAIWINDDAAEISNNLIIRKPIGKYFLATIIAYNLKGFNKL